MAKGINKVSELPAITRRMIHFLPSLVGYEPIELSDLLRIKTEKGKVSDILKKILENISLIPNPQVVKKVEEELAIQLAIICHGYEGICPNDYSANQIAKQAKMIGNE